MLKGCQAARAHTTFHQIPLLAPPTLLKTTRTLINRPCHRILNSSTQPPTLAQMVLLVLRVYETGTGVLSRYQIQALPPVNLPSPCSCPNLNMPFLSPSCTPLEE